MLDFHREIKVNFTQWLFHKALLKILPKCESIFYPGSPRSRCANKTRSVYNLLENCP